MSGPKWEKMSMLLLAVLGSLLVQAVPSASEEPIHPLRVVTYNVLHDGPTSGFKDSGSHLDDRLEMTIRELQALEPDIVALQEASQSRRHGDVPARIARRLGFNHIFAPATEHIFRFWPLDKLIVGIMGFKEGSAILSRFPIVTSAVYDLPRCRRFIEPRILLRAELSTPWGPLHIFSTHTARNDECQIERVGEIVREGRGAGPSLLMGDFNTPETAKVLATLRNEAAFVDVFRLVNPDAAGPTVWQRIESESPTVSRRVDYIFLLSGRESSGTVRSSRIVLDRPGSLPDGAALWPSDHYGVFAEVDIVPLNGSHAAAR